MWRIIDISGDGYYLSVKNDNLSILKDNKEVLHACFADINSIICSGNNIVYTNAVIQKCLENKIPLTFLIKLAAIDLYLSCPAVSNKVNLISCPFSNIIFFCLKSNPKVDM